MFNIDVTATRLRDNEAAFDRYKIKPRILVNVDNMDTSSELFGKKASVNPRLRGNKSLLTDSIDIDAIGVQPFCHAPSGSP